MGLLLKRIKVEVAIEQSSGMLGRVISSELSRSRRAAHLSSSMASSSIFVKINLIFVVENNASVSPRCLAFSIGLLC
jgi:hypothetical protein